MSEKVITAKFYRTPAGREPVRAWLISLPKTERAIIGGDLKAAEFGWPIGLPLSRSLGDGLFEIRSSLPNKIARIIFFVHGGDMWLVSAFIKKQQKNAKKRN